MFNFFKSVLIDIATSLKTSFEVTCKLLGSLLELSLSCATKGKDSITRVLGTLGFVATAAVALVWVWALATIITNLTALVFFIAVTYGYLWLMALVTGNSVQVLCEKLYKGATMFETDIISLRDGLIA